MSRYTAEFLFYSVFPLYLKRLGYNGTQIGTILSFAPLLLVLALPIWSRFDGGNSRKKVLIIAAVVTVILQAVLSLPLPYCVFIMMAVLYSIFRAPFYPSIDSMATIFALENNLEYSSLRAYGSLGYIVGVVLGTAMLDTAGFLWILVLSTVIFTALMITSYSLKPLSVDKSVEAKGDIKLLFTNFRFLMFLIAQILIYAMFILNNNYDLLYLDFRGVKSYYFGIMTLLRVSIEILMLNYLARLKKLNFKTLFMIVPFLFILQSSMYYFNMPVYLTMASSVLTGVPGAIMIFLQNKYISRIVRPKNITMATYITALVQNLFIGIFTLLAGIIMDKTGINNIYLFSGISFVISVFFVSVFIKDTGKKNVFVK